MNENQLTAKGAPAQQQAVVSREQLEATVIKQHGLLDTLLAALVTADPAFRITQSPWWADLQEVAAVFNKVKAVHGQQQ